VWFFLKPLVKSPPCFFPPNFFGLERVWLLCPSGTLCLSLSRWRWLILGFSLLCFFSRRSWVFGRFTWVRFPLLQKKIFFFFLLFFTWFFLPFPFFFLSDFYFPSPSDYSYHGPVKLLFSNASEMICPQISPFWSLAFSLVDLPLPPGPGPFPHFFLLRVSTNLPPFLTPPSVILRIQFS